MFSSRTRWDLQPNRLSLLLARQRSQGRQLLDLTQSNPTHAGIPCPEDVLAPLAHPDARRYDPSPFGLASARAAVATDFQRRGFPVPPEQVFLSASTSEAYAFLFKLLADPGDEILVPRPGYPLFDFLATLESVEVLSYPLSYDGAWHLDVAALRSAVGPRTRAIVVVNPNNPTGAFLKRDELGALQELLRRAPAGAHLGRGVCRLRVLRRSAARARRRRRRARAQLRPRRPLEELRPAAAEARLDGGLRSRTPAHGGARATRGDRRHVPVGLDSGAGGAPGSARSPCRARGPDP